MIVDQTTGRKVHRKKETPGFRGNLAYASANALQMKTTSRRDDLQSLFFLLYHLITGRIFGVPDTPGTQLPPGAKDTIKGIIKARSNIDSQIFAAENRTKGLVEFAAYVFNLQYDEEPNYNKISFLFMKNLLDLNLTPSNDFDWNKMETMQGKIAALQKQG